MLIKKTKGVLNIFSTFYLFWGGGGGGGGGLHMENGPDMYIQAREAYSCACFTVH